MSFLTPITDRPAERPARVRNDRAGGMFDGYRSFCMGVCVRPWHVGCVLGLVHREQAIYMQLPDESDYRGPGPQGLYDPSQEHAACGVGFLAHLDGRATHTLVEQSSEVLRNLLHRGAAGGDPSTGDGAGILTLLPDTLCRRLLAARQIKLPPAGSYGVGMFFLARAEAARAACERVVSEVLRAEGLRLL
ncbi:MAG: hypothetical protein PHR35_21835, partial [Kiritimatiellae bacterium]|nr:hypothetical protein [Kiritimatiellia bacterium]